MGVKKFIKKSVAFVAAAAMALTMVVAPVGAGATYAAEGTEDNLHLNKGIELQSDGNYKITLEAYSTGKDTTATTDKAVPLDIVLVLDQSGSMKNDFTSSETYNVQTKKEYSYRDLQNGQYYYKDSNDVYYEVKISSEGGFLGWGVTYYAYYQKDGTTYYFYNNNITTEKKGISDYDSIIWKDNLYTRKVTTTTRLNALKSAVTNFVNSVEQNAIGDPKTTEDDVDHRIAIVGFASESGYGDNTEILSVSGNNSNTVGVKYDSSNNYTNATKIAFQDTTTDAGKNMLSNAINALAANGATRTDLGMKMAKDILSNNPKKDEVGRKKLVIMFTDGTPTTQSDFSTSVANAAILNAKAIKDDGGKVYSIGIFDNADPNGTSQENKFMNYVSSNYPEATRMDIAGNEIEKPVYYKTASDAGQLSDVFESIQHSETTSGTSVTLTSDSVLRDIISDKFELPEGAEASAVSVYEAPSTSVSKDGTINWGTRTNANYTVNASENRVDVTGFDYSQNYVTANHPGKKLIVEILVNGLQSGIDMESNDTEQAKSGIYKNSSETTAVKNFVSPKVTIPEYSYVLDYGKKVTIPNTDQSQNKAYSETTQINSTKAAPSKSTSIKKTYGTFALENNTLTYQPGKINWDGFDSIFSFGKKTGDEYEWSKTNVIPANSVYYEDDFGTDKNTDSNVAIVWTGSWSKDGTSQDETQSDKNSQYGWDDSYKGDTGYSNGSAHVSSQNFATATFRFTGTGVDVYSRTNEGVGKISTSLKKVTKNAEGTETVKTIKYKSIDNLSVSGDYYQIPTLNYDDLDYGTYEVTIKVITVSAENRGTYYLDGIRVYNPLGKVDDNSVAGKAYKEAGESNAQYIQVRKDLLDSSKVQAIDTAIKGSLFIDKSEEGITDIGTYKDYGPKNEVYLKSDTEKNKIQGVAFNINGYNSDNNKVFIGLKSPTGKEVTVKVTSGDKVEEIKLKSAADLYYQITPDTKGNVVIENMSDNLLSITKVRITSKVLPTNNFALTSTPELISYVNTFDALQEKQDTNQKDTADTLDKGDVDINNPGDNDTNKDNSSQDNNEQTKPDNTWNKIMNSIKSWFRR